MISLENKKIIIVEDDVWYAEHITRLLEKEGAECHVAEHPAQAIDVIDAVQPDVIILDMLLTGSTGLVLLHELQSHSDLATIPVIVCSTILDTLQVDKLRPYGVRRTLDKTTMHPGDIPAAVRGVLV